MGFFRTVFSVCTGTKDFPKLISRSPFRALLHLVLFCIILGLLAAFCRRLEYSSDCASLTGSLGKYFGGVTIGKKGIVPDKNADTPKAFILTKKLRLNYIPNGEKGADAKAILAKMDSWEQPSGIIWTPAALMLWLRVEGSAGEYMLYNLPASPEAADASMLAYKRMSGTDMAGRVISAVEAPVKGVSAGELALSPDDVAAFAMRSFTAMMAGIFTMAFLMLGVITPLLFAGAQQIWKNSRYDNLKFGALYTLMTYSAFPALGAAAITAALKIEFVSFQLVFFVVFFIYHLFAFMTVQKFLRPEPPKRNDGGDDIF